MATASTGDDALDAMAHSVAVARLVEQHPPGWGPDRKCPETCG